MNTFVNFHAIPGIQQCCKKIWLEPCMSSNRYDIWENVNKVSRLMMPVHYVLYRAIFLHGDLQDIFLMFQKFFHVLFSFCKVFAVDSFVFVSFNIVCAAFALKHPLVASVIFGATKMWQLKEVIEACQVELRPEIISDIDNVHLLYPNPCP